MVQIHAKVYQFDTHTSENKNLHDLSSYDVIIKTKIKDIHHCKETDHVYAIVRTGHGQPTWSYQRPVSGGHHLGDPWFRLSTLGY